MEANNAPFSCRHLQREASGGNLLFTPLNYLKPLIWQWLIACFIFPLTMSAVGDKKNNPRSIFKQSVTSWKKAHVLFFCFFRKKHARRNPVGLGSSINQAALLEQRRRHAPLNSQHQSVVDSALIRPLMMTYHFFLYIILYLFLVALCFDRLSEGVSEWVSETVREWVRPMGR